VTDTFFADIGCAGDSRAVGAGFLNSPSFTVSSAFAASIGLAIVAEARFFVLEVGNEVEFFVGLGCTVPA
jgi:hypothetical protein